MRVLTEDAYTRAAESSPNGNGDGDVAARAGMVDSGQWWCLTGWGSSGILRWHLTLSQAHPTQTLNEEI
jgi:hypothetical protein